MTQHPDVYLSCDQCHTAFGKEIWFPTAKDARKAAKDEGWVNYGSDDYCPECK